MIKAKKIMGVFSIRSPPLLMEEKSNSGCVEKGDVLMEKQDFSNEREGRKEKERILSKDEKAIVVISAIVIIILLLLRSCGISKEVVEYGVIDLPDKTTAMQMVNDAVERGMFQVFMNTEVSLDKDGYASLLIQNSEANHYPCYVLIEHDGKIIYQSEIIQPGYKIERDKLMADIGPGVHDCNAYFCVLDELGAELNRIGVNVTINGGQNE